MWNILHTQYWIFIEIPLLCLNNLREQRPRKDILISIINMRLIYKSSFFSHVLQDIPFDTVRPLSQQIPVQCCIMQNKWMGFHRFMWSSLSLENWNLGIWKESRLLGFLYLLELSTTSRFLKIPRHHMRCCFRSLRSNVGNNKK